MDGILHADLLPEEASRELSAAWRRYKDPYVGITTDGIATPGLYKLTDTGISCRKAVDAAQAYLKTLAAYQIPVARLAMDSEEWRLWTNAFPVWTPKGLRLDRISVTQREAILAIMEASLSPEGFSALRSVMKLNGALGEYVGDYGDTLSEYTYHFSVFGAPSTSEPWGWQLMGHHADVHCVFIGSQLVLAPVFLGAEPAVAQGVRYAGVRAFDAETGRGLDLRRALSPDQEDRFLLSESVLSADLPPELAGPFNGRHLAGAGQDNLRLPLEGIAGNDLTPDQQDLLLDLVKVYAGRLPADHATHKIDQFVDHLDATRFVWRGGHGESSAFYYRVHSPVLLIEYDNHPGIFLDNEEPERFHVHTIVREPNGNDYGMNLLAQHYALHHS
ncbi:DUF3500 domain-containing protein [Streptomyces sp. NBC_00063]|uniref:DUF3500 domain-containing protein n=1 Tax=Streptomyces sp. NBC_00063 TaxID=2975638 RepID=UPI003D75D425